jgi:hypothetical protein
MAQPCGEPIRKPVFFHPLLSAGNIVGHAVVPDYIMVTIVDSVAGTGIAITRLPHASGIDDETVTVTGMRGINGKLVEQTFPIGG